MGRQGWYEEAVAELEKALKMRSRMLGASHPLVANSHVNLAWIRAKQGREQDCRRHLQDLVQTGFCWTCKSFLESEDDFAVVRETEWFRAVLDQASVD